MQERKSPPAFITNIEITDPLNKPENGQSTIALNGQKNVQLKYTQNSFSIRFNIQNYALVNQVEYAYMLKGLENSWYTLTDPNNVTFRNLPPGKYQFQVKTRMRNQAWSDATTSLNIRIAPPLWLTWWAKSFYILLSLIILFSILYAYKKRLDAEALYQLEKQSHEHEQELNNERLRFYTNITHELRTPLTLILGPLEDIQKSDTLSTKDAQKISVIHQSAIRLLNLINQILEKDRDPEQETLREPGQPRTPYPRDRPEVQGTEPEASRRYPAGGGERAYAYILRQGNYPDHPGQSDIQCPKVHGKG